MLLGLDLVIGEDAMKVKIICIVLFALFSACQAKHQGIALKPEEIPQLDFVHAAGTRVGEQNYIYCYKSGVVSKNGSVEFCFEYVTLDYYDLQGARRCTKRLVDQLTTLFLENPYWDKEFYKQTRKDPSLIRKQLSVSVDCIDYKRQYLRPPAISRSCFRNNMFCFFMKDSRTASSIIVAQETYEEAECRLRGNSPKVEKQTENKQEV